MAPSQVGRSFTFCALPMLHKMGAGGDLMQGSKVLERRILRGLVLALHERGAVTEAVYRALLEQVR